MIRTRSKGHKRQHNYWKLGFIMLSLYLIATWCSYWLPTGGGTRDSADAEFDVTSYGFFDQHQPKRKLTNLNDGRLRGSASMVVYNLSDQVPITDPLDCIMSKTDIPFNICVYENERDKYISASLRSTGKWEPRMTDIVTKGLQAYPNAQFIDIGANIGYYTFLAGKLGHGVLAVEPAIENAIRLHKGTQLNKLQDRIFLLLNAVSDKHDHVMLTKNADNQGGLWMGTLGQSQQKQSHSLHDRYTIQTITLNNLLEVTPFSQAIIKVDIEGFECKAFANTETFLQSVDVPYIFMEWRKMYTARHTSKSPCPVRAMRRLTSMLTDMGYEPIEVWTGFHLDAGRSTSAWRIGDVYWKHRTAWQLQVPY